MSAPDTLSFSGEGAVDLRTRVPNAGSVSSTLHGTYFRLRTESATPQPVSLNVFGSSQYGSYRWQQVTVEKEWSQGNGSRLPTRVQAGVLRLPFGIYDYRETYASGLIDYPMPRVDYGYNEVDWGVPGVQWSGGNTFVQTDVAAFSGQGIGTWGNINHTEGIGGRTQFFLPPHLIVGVSRWEGRLAPDPLNPSQRLPVHLSGLDWRYTLSHLLLRGEFLAGQMPGASRTRGGYLDAYYRLPGLEKLTLVGRVEALRPGDANPEARQLTLGLRWTVTPDWMLAANWRRNNLSQAYLFTWTPPAERRGDLLFQVLRTFSFSR